MRLSIHHRTSHRYSGPVSFSDHALFLCPREIANRHVRRFEVSTTPEASLRWVQDMYGNQVMVCGFGLQTSEELSFEVSIEVELEEENPFEFLLQPYAVSFPFEYTPEDRRALIPFLLHEQEFLHPSVMPWFEQRLDTLKTHENTVQFFLDLSKAVYEGITYVAREEEGIQTPQQTIDLGTGSCRDLAMLFLMTVRALGYAARFVSGYLYDEPGEDVFNRAVGSMHAWVEVYLPGAGWKGFDPTNGVLANSFFLPTAVSHSAKGVEPIQGAYYSKVPQTSEMEIELTVERRDDPE